MAIDERDRGWNVDAAPTPGSYVTYLEQNTESDLMRRTVAERLDALGIAGCRSRCGLGTHARMLAEVAPEAHVTGVDQSRTLLTSARERGSQVRYVRADVQHLPFPDASFDLVWVERTLVHVDEPLSALRELRRVLAPSARAVVAEGDYAGVLLDCEDGALWQQLHGHWLQRPRHPAIGRRLPGLLHHAGFAAIELRPELRTTPNVAWMERAFGLRQRCAELVDGGVLTTARADAFWSDLERRESAGCFFMAIPFVVAVAR